MTLVTLAADDIQLVQCQSCDLAAFADEALEIGWTCDDARNWSCSRECAADAGIVLLTLALAAL